MPATVKQARLPLAARLHARREEILRATLTRVYGVADAPEGADPDYVEGLRAAISAALDYGLVAIERGEERAPPIPPILLTQARMAAQHGIPLDTVLRRYFAGYTLLGDFVIEEAEEGALLMRSALKRLLRTQATLFDRLIAAVTEEYAREASGRHDTSEQRRAERIRRLLAGELLDTSDLAYNFEAHHLGAIATGAGAMEAVRELASALDCLALAVPGSEESVWVWLGARRNLDPDRLGDLVSATWPPRTSLAIGEPARGIGGWRLTHQQARAALPIALRSPQRVIRYADVALLASMLQDDLLATSLRQIYLEPLAHERDGGDVAKETLRAYFGADRNITSAAAALGVDRNTVANRLRAVEESIERPLRPCAAELEAALQLEELGLPPENIASAAR